MIKIPNNMIRPRSNERDDDYPLTKYLNFEHLSPPNVQVRVNCINKSKQTMQIPPPMNCKLAIQYFPFFESNLKRQKAAAYTQCHNIKV